jgi:hypothetical protein
MYWAILIWVILIRSADERSPRSKMLPLSSLFSPVFVDFVCRGLTQPPLPLDLLLVLPWPVLLSWPLLFLPAIVPRIAHPFDKIMLENHTGFAVVLVITLFVFKLVLFQFNSLHDYLIKVSRQEFHCNDTNTQL